MSACAIMLERQWRTGASAQEPRTTWLEGQILKKSTWLGAWNLRYATISTDGLGGAVLEWYGGDEPGSVPLDEHCLAHVVQERDSLLSTRTTATLIVCSAKHFQELRFRAAPFDPDEVVPTIAEWHGALIAAKRGLQSSPGGRTALLAPALSGGTSPLRSRNSSNNSSRTNLTHLLGAEADEP